MSADPKIGDVEPKKFSRTFDTLEKQRIKLVIQSPPKLEMTLIKPPHFGLRHRMATIGQNEPLVDWPSQSLKYNFKSFLIPEITSNYLRLLVYKPADSKVSFKEENIIKVSNYFYKLSTIQQIIIRFKRYYELKGEKRKITDNGNMEFHIINLLDFENNG